MNKELIIKVILIFLSLSLTFTTIELGIRAFLLYPQSFYEPNPYFGWDHVPNKEGWFYHYAWGPSEYKTYIKINSKGLRDYEYSYEKPEDTFRILVLGDSMTEALQVPLEKSYSKVLEKKLNFNIKNYTKFEVINTGVSGYGTDNEVLFFENEGYKYNPDLVILAFFSGTDVRNNYIILEERHRRKLNKPYFLLDDEKLELYNYPAEKTSGNEIKNFFIQNFRTVRILQRMLIKLKIRIAEEQIELPSEYNLYLKERPNDWNIAWNITEKLLLRSKEKVEKSNASFIIVSLPNSNQVHTDEREDILNVYGGHNLDIENPNRILESICKNNNIVCIDLLPHFMEYHNTTEERLHYLKDRHLNEDGHTVAADVVFEYLIKNDFVK